MTLAEISAALAAFSGGVSGRPNIEWSITSSNRLIKFQATNISIKIMVIYDSREDDWRAQVEHTAIGPGTLSSTLQGTLSTGQTLLESRRLSDNADIGKLTNG